MARKTALKKDATEKKEALDKETAKTTEKKVAKRKERLDKETITKKTPLKVKPTKGVDVKETKYVLTAVQGEKRMWMRGSSVGLTHKIAGIKGFKPVSVEDAKKNHLGKTRMLGKITTQEDLDSLVEKFFA